MTDYSKRENCPLDVGDVIIDESGERLEFIDWPTDGPLFALLDQENDSIHDHPRAQFEAETFAEKWTTNELHYETDD